MNAKEIVKNYKGVIDPRIIASLITKAKRLSLPEHMIEDVIQDFVAEILTFNYDSAKSNGASQITAILAIFEHKIIDIVRRIDLEKDFLEQESHRVVTERDELRSLQMSMDIESALDVLSITERRICMMLANGMSINEIAARQNTRNKKIANMVSRIRAKLTNMNLRDYLGEKDC